MTNAPSTPAPNVSAPAAPPRRRAVPAGQLLINGQWLAAQDGATMQTVDPTTEKPIATVATGGRADAEQAVAAARRAFDEGPWPTLGHEAGTVPTPGGRTTGASAG